MFMVLLYTIVRTNASRFEDKWLKIFGAKVCNIFFGRIYGQSWKYCHFKWNAKN